MLGCIQEFPFDHNVSYSDGGSVAHERLLYHSIHAVDGYRGLSPVLSAASVPGAGPNDQRLPLGDRLGE